MDTLDAMLALAYLYQGETGKSYELRNFDGATLEIIDAGDHSGSGLVWGRDEPPPTFQQLVDALPEARKWDASRPVPTMPHPPATTGED